MGVGRLGVVLALSLVATVLGACATTDKRQQTGVDSGGSGGTDGSPGTGGMDVQGGGGGTGAAAPDAAVSCRPNPSMDPACPEICPEACNEIDDDCDGVIDEGADEADCAVDHAISVCTRGLCILASCDQGFRDCDDVRDNGCEVDISGVDNCGACGNRCEFDNTVALCVDGACEPGACIEPYLDCIGDDGLCDTFGETLSDCGSCGQPCEAAPRATPACLDGQCVVDECIGNFGDCNDDAADGCELPLDSASHCGGCGIPCAFAGSATNCDGGACIIDACSPGYADCDGSALTACDSLDTDAHCGGCGRACTVDALQNVVGAGCQSRACVVECASGFDDCDGVANGCETPLTGINNCTGCGMACRPNHASGDCSGGSCQVAVCDSGWADCDDDPSNGCETDTGRPDNCGGCGIQCQINPNPIGCNGTICTGILCPEGEADCDGNDTCEASLAADATCGSCNVVCAFDNNVNGHGSVACAVENAMQGQMAWGCEVTCADGFADCDGDYRNGCEVNLTDLDNCGTCGSVCTKSHSTPTCENRVCEVGTCDLDWGDCDGDDLDCETQLNSAGHCGTCGNACSFPSAQGVCSGNPGNRQCIISQCVPVEYEDCDGDKTTGCEVDTRTDANNCNGCGNDCTMGPQVQGGVCVDSDCSYTCQPYYRDCTAAAGCETDLLSTSTCGDCSTNCNALPQVTAATCQPGGGSPVCEITGCSSGYGDCNGDPADGCEVTTNTSAQHCGACSGDAGNQPCTNLPNVDNSSCGGGNCRINQCTGNYEDCDGNPANGCEHDPAVDPPCCDPMMDDDGDGSDNCADQCPSDPAKTAPGTCGCFVAETNSDGDGAPDCIDGCPYNANFTGSCQARRKPLTIQGAQVPAAQTDFPVLVRFGSDADLAFYADPSGLDIYFEDDLGNALPFERESYVSGSGALVAWVRITLTSADQVFYVYYGDGDRTEKSSPGAVWDSGFRGVWHLGEAAGNSQTVTQSGIPEDGTGMVACTAGRTITSFTSRYGTNGAGGSCPVACGGCTIGAASCSQLFNNATCGDCSVGVVKTATLEIVCGTPGLTNDSTANGYDGTQVGTSPVTGLVGNAANFVATDYIDMPSAAATGLTTQITASMWLYGDPATQPQTNFSFMIGTDIADRISAHSPWSDGTVYWDSGGCCGPGQRISKSLSSDCADLNNCNLAEGQWNHWVFAKNTASASAATDGAKVYINGALWHWGEGTVQMANTFASFKLGSNNVGTSNYSGYMDEFRLSSIERSANWIAIEYANQRPGSTFLFVGAQEIP